MFLLLLTFNFPPGQYLLLPLFTLSYLGSFIYSVQFSKHSLGINVKCPPPPPPLNPPHPPHRHPRQHQNQHQHLTQSQSSVSSSSSPSHSPSTTPCQGPWGWSWWRWSGWKWSRWRWSGWRWSRWRWSEWWWSGWRCLGWPGWKCLCQFTCRCHTSPAPSKIARQTREEAENKPIRFLTGNLKITYSWLESSKNLTLSLADIRISQCSFITWNPELVSHFVSSSNLLNDDNILYLGLGWLKEC